MKCWRTFGIHFLIKALEDGAEEWATYQSAQAAYSLKRSLPVPRSSRGWFCPKIQILEQGSSQLTRWPGVSEHVCGAEPPKSLAACQWIYIFIYIAIYLGDGDGGIPNCLLASRVGAVKKYWIHNCIWPPQWPRLKSLWELFSDFNFFFFNRRAIRRKIW